MFNNYDHIAKYYDRLSRVVFGRAQIKAQTVQFPYISKNSSILIVGGGTGCMLEALSNRQPEGLKITYVESSFKMIELARKVDYKQNSVNFIHKEIQNFDCTETFDVVITAFLFDNFSSETAGRVFQKIDVLLKMEGHWLYADFAYRSQTKRGWQHLLLKSMYAFFKIVAQVEASKLPDMSMFFKENQYHLLFQRRYYKDFIASCVYKKARYADLSDH